LRIRHVARGSACSSKFINKNDLTVWFSVPSIPAQMRKRNLWVEYLPALRWSLFCGAIPSQRGSVAGSAPKPLRKSVRSTELTIATLYIVGIEYLPRIMFQWDGGDRGDHAQSNSHIGGRSSAPSSRRRAWRAMRSGIRLPPDIGEASQNRQRFVKIPMAGKPDVIFYRTSDQARQLLTASRLSRPRRSPDQSTGVFALS
jgi:hypothetical protein